MCLAVPMMICEIGGDGTGLCDCDGSRREVDLSLVSDPRIGDYVIVHAGYAIEKLDVAEALERLSLFQEMIEARRKP